MEALPEALSQLFDRDLAKLEEEISNYPTEELLWVIRGDVKNSGGNLCLHLCGNLQHFMGAVLGQTGYKRDRGLEFSARNVARKKLLSEVEQTRQVVRETLGKLAAADLTSQYPLQVLGYPMTTTYFLVHLYGHLNYHLGQVNYLRRLLQQPPSSI
jgi:uncharacterized damage-inducible protein DinB